MPQQRRVGDILCLLRPTPIVDWPGQNGSFYTRHGMALGQVGAERQGPSEQSTMYDDWAKGYGHLLPHPLPSREDVL